MQYAVLHAVSPRRIVGHLVVRTDIRRIRTACVIVMSTVTHCCLLCVSVVISQLLIAYSQQQGQPNCLAGSTASDDEVYYC